MKDLSDNTTHVLILLSAVVFMAVVNGTMINVALPYIGKDFAVTEGTYGWVVTGYVLSFGIFNAVDGRLADVLGKRRLYLFGIATLGLTSIAVALSPTIEFAIAVRIAQGAGAAALPALGTAIISQLVPVDRRGAAMGVILSTVGVAASIGPFLGGFLVQFAGWRFVFAFTGLVLFALPFGWKLLPEKLDRTTASTFDIVGAVLMSVGVAAVLYAFEAIETHGFGLYAAGIVAAGVATLGVFGWWIRRKKDPFVEPDLFVNWRYVATCAVAFVTNATRFGTIVLVPIFLVEINELEPIWVGAVLFPGAFFIAILSTRAGQLADRVGPRIPVGAGATFIVLGNLVTAYYAGGSAIGVTVGMALYGIGFAAIQSPLVSTASQIVPDEQQGVGLGIFMMIFFVGGAFGVALSVTTVELQAVDSASWVGLDVGEGARFSNGILALTALALIGMALVPGLPKLGTGGPDGR